MAPFPKDAPFVVGVLESEIESPTQTCRPLVAGFTADFQMLAASSSFSVVLSVSIEARDCCAGAHAPGAAPWPSSTFVASGAGATWPRPRHAVRQIARRHTWHGAVRADVGE